MRDAIARRFTARGLPTSSEQILVVNGALQALDLTVRALLRRGRVALAEIPGYPASLDVLRAAGARVRHLPIGPAGWDLEQLEALAARRPSLAYLIPDFQNPSGVLIDAASRRRAMRVLRSGETTVVIDETFVELNLDDVEMPPPAASFGDARTITIGSLSKPVWGGLRIGWLRADPATVHRIAALRAITDMASPVLEQLVAVGVFEVSRLDRRGAEGACCERDARRSQPHSTSMRPPGSTRRRTAACSSGSSCLRRRQRASPLRARERGVHFTPGPRFGAAGLLDRYLRLPFTLPADQLDRAVEILAAEAGEPAVASRTKIEPAYVV